MCGCQTSLRYPTIWHKPSTYADDAPYWDLEVSGVTNDTPKKEVDLATAKEFEVNISANAPSKTAVKRINLSVSIYFELPAGFFFRDGFRGFSTSFIDGPLAATSASHRARIFFSAVACFLSDARFTS